MIEVGKEEWKERRKKLGEWWGARVPLFKELREVSNDILPPSHSNQNVKLSSNSVRDFLNGILQPPLQYSTMPSTAPPRRGATAGGAGAGGLVCNRCKKSFGYGTTFSFRVMFSLIEIRIKF
jgi:hypothetical protein